MPYRSTQDKHKARTTAHKLYVQDGLSLEEISRQTGETIKTLRAWRNLGEWEAMREKDARTELDRLNSLRDSLLDRAEAQLEAGRMPHTEIGLLYKVERMIDQKKRRKQEIAPAMVLYTLDHLVKYLLDHDPKMARAFADHIRGFAKWVQSQDFIHAPE